MIDPETQPALFRLLNPGTFQEVPPWHCQGCPFAGEDAEPYYACGLLGKRVWGVNPDCTEDDWRNRAREELTRQDPEPHLDRAVEGA